LAWQYRRLAWRLLVPRLARQGVWLVVGGPGYDWYAFDAPIYPYPPYPGAPPPVVGPALSPGAGFWYFC
jgi:hypothetical protein